MWSVLLLSSDPALFHALSEQADRFSFGKDAPLHFSVCSTTVDALSCLTRRESPLVVIDDAIVDDSRVELPLLADELFAPIVFVLGGMRLDLESVLVTEMFPKPVRLGYLFMRMQFRLQSVSYNSEASFVLGGWRFAPRKRQLCHSASGAVVSLSDKEASLLEYLYRADRPVSRQELLESVWGYDPAADTHTLETHIYRLRRKFADAGDVMADQAVFVVEQGGYRINPLWRDA